MDKKYIFGLNGGILLQKGFKGFTWDIHVGVWNTGNKFIVDLVLSVFGFFHDVVGFFAEYFLDEYFSNIMFGFHISSSRIS